jgi:hypothetical protein
VETTTLTSFVETYPVVPSPWTVEVRFPVVIPPPPLAVEIYPSVPSPMKDERLVSSKYEVLTKLRRFGVDTNPGVHKVAVETKSSKLGVETNPGVHKVAVETKSSKLGVETNPGVHKVAVETKSSKLGVETSSNKLLVETKFNSEET